MTERKHIDEKMRVFFEELWRCGDPWDLGGSTFEQVKYVRQIKMLQGRQYARALEIGCGAGYFSRLLAHIADHVVALDIAPTAIERARAARTRQGGEVDFRVANIMDYDLHAEGPWDLVVISETIYYLGWLYTFFDVGWLASELFTATRGGGRLLMANTYDGVEDYLIRPWLIQTYRDLFLNVGYCVEAEEVFHGTKNGANLKVLLSLFGKMPQELTASDSLASNHE